jgi:hypothetical protein
MELKMRPFKRRSWIRQAAATVHFAWFIIEPTDGSTEQANIPRAKNEGNSKSVKFVEFIKYLKHLIIEKNWKF